MSLLGMYFGSKLISIVESRGRKTVSSVSILQSTVSTGELGEKVPSELKSSEIVSLIKGEMLKNRIQAKEAILCLSGKDLIIRNFEVPILPKDELRAAVNFEAKKYIPFRVEDMVSDSQLQIDTVNRKNLVLFMGIKKETLDRYVAILNQLGIKIKGIEYSAFSLLRSVALTGGNVKGTIGVLGADTQEEDEANFTVLENGFPLFSRDISFAAGAPDELMAKPEAAGAQGALDKLKNEIRVSLDYYHRKFPTKNIQKILFLSPVDQRMDLESFFMESGLSVQYLDVAKQAGNAAPFSLSFAKAYTASLAPAIRTDIRLNLSLTEKKEKPVAVKVGVGRAEAASLVKGFRVDLKIVLLALLICGGTFAYGKYNLKPVEQELAATIGARVKVASVAANATYSDLTNAKTKYMAKIDSLNKVVTKQLYLTKPLDVIPQVIPPGVWLTNFAYGTMQNGLELTLKGTAYVGDADKELELVNQFAADLKSNPDFSKTFKDIAVLSVDRGRIEKIDVANFSISCKSYQREQ